MSTACRCLAISCIHRIHKKTNHNHYEHHSPRLRDSDTNMITQITVRDFSAVGICCTSATSYAMTCFGCGDRLTVIFGNGNCFCRRMNKTVTAQKLMQTLSETLPLPLRPFIQKECLSDIEYEESDFDIDAVFSPKRLEDPCVGSFYNYPFSMPCMIEWKWIYGKRQVWQILTTAFSIWLTISFGECLALMVGCVLTMERQSSNSCTGSCHVFCQSTFQCKNGS